jgi:KDO2-lipid IV(A) lauroyltransferase
VQRDENDPGETAGEGQERSQPALRRPARPPKSDRAQPRPLRALAGRALFALTARLPFRLAYALGGLVGRLLYALPGRTRKATRVNLALCFPERTSRERARLGARSAASTARFALELGGIWNRPPGHVLDLVREVHGLDAIAAALSEGRGLVAITPHLGSWELAGLWASSRWPTTFLYKPPRSSEMETYYRERRERLGARLVPAGPSGVSALLRALRAGEPVAILPDQDPGRGSGLFAPFFGVPANTSVLIPRLLQRTGARAFLVACVRLPAGRGFALHFVPAADALHDPDVERATAAMNADIERLVRRFPEQYLWSYRRFRERPQGVPDRYA